MARAPDMDMEGGDNNARSGLEENEVDQLVAMRDQLESKTEDDCKEDIL